MAATSITVTHATSYKTIELVFETDSFKMKLSVFTLGCNVVETDIRGEVFTTVICGSRKMAIKFSPTSSSAVRFSCEGFEGFIPQESFNEFMGALKGSTARFYSRQDISQEQATALTQLHF